MKTKVIIALVLTAVISLSFTASSVKERKSVSTQVEINAIDNGPVGGLVIEDKI